MKPSKAGPDAALSPASAVGAAGRGDAERRVVGLLIGVTLCLTSLPYLLGYYITPPGTTFIGTVYNIDDYCNYLSWLRQAADGHFFLRNLFTTDPQKGLEFNLFFWLLGHLARLTRLSLQAALQLARVGGGLGLLWLISRFYAACTRPGDRAARVTAFGFACLSSGLGWLTWARWQDINPPGSPVDAWQPEAFTFLSLYTSALFTVSTLLIVGALYALLLGEMTGRWRYPVIAGLCGAILGNIHSYDVLHISAAWGLFLVVWTVLKRGRGVGATWRRSLLALALTLPTTLYQYYVFQAEMVFRERAEVATLSPAFRHYILGYGLVFVLALIALAWKFWPARTRQGESEKTEPMPRASAERQPSLSFTLTACWAAAGLAVIYLPVAFQRKMLMGEHIPLCLLAGYGASLLTGRMPPRARALALAGLVLATFPSNALFLRRDMIHMVQNRSETTDTTGQRPFISDRLLDAYRWIARSTPPEAAVVGVPELCTALPGYAGHAVWAGHWGETPHYGRKVAAFARFADVTTPDDERRAFLASTRAQYLLYLNDVSGAGFTSRGGVRHNYADFSHAPPAYLVPVYSNRDYALFQIDLAR